MHKSNQLHKILHIILVVVIFLAIILIVIAFSINHLNTHQESTQPKSVSDCKILGKNHFIYINKNKFEPNDLSTNICDSITFVNQDKYRELRFGEHDNHTKYDNIGEINLHTGESHTIILKNTGDYQIHDHLQDYVYGKFSVSERTN